MEVIVLASPEEVVAYGADLVAQQVQRLPSSVLGLATGETMEGVYANLRARSLDFSGVTTFQLDEYLGLSPDSPESYAYYMRHHLFEHVNLDPGRCHLLDGLATDLAAHCAAYEQAIAASGGIDLQLLGIGRDGHLAFNEPGSSLASRTRWKVLTPDTRQRNALHFAPDHQVPIHVLTMGLGSIMEARHCLLLAYGSVKAPAIAAAVEGPVTSSCPASVLQMHPRCTLVLDESAAGQLARIDYYRFAFANRPPGWG